MIHLVQKTYLSIVDNEKNLIWNSYNSREGFSTEQFSANVFFIFDDIFVYRSKSYILPKRKDVLTLLNGLRIVRSFLLSQIFS